MFPSEVTVMGTLTHLFALTHRNTHRLWNILKKNRFMFLCWDTLVKPVFWWQESNSYQEFFNPMKCCSYICVRERVVLPSASTQSLNAGIHCFSRRVSSAVIPLHQGFYTTHFLSASHPVTTGSYLSGFTFIPLSWLLVLSDIVQNLRWVCV